MFSKYVTLLAFAASAIAGVIEPGRYLISSAASGTTARTYRANSPVYVSNSLENPGVFQIWDIRNSKDGSYTLHNVGLRTSAYASHGGVIETSRREATSFNIEPAGDGQFVIKLPYKDSLWNAEPPVVPRGDIKLRPANGDLTERWILTVHHLAQPEDDYDERWDLLQRIGRFLGRPEY